MKDVEGFWATVQAWFDHHTTIGAVLMSAWISLVRMIYDGKRDWKSIALESTLCGSMTLALTSALDVFGVPHSSASFVGGVVGFIGVEKVRSATEKWVGRKAG